MVTTSIKEKNDDPRLKDLYLLQSYRKLVTDHDPFGHMVCKFDESHLPPIVQFSEDKGPFLLCLACDSKSYPGGNTLAGVHRDLPLLIIFIATH
jgi:hypothetical protein